MAARSGKRGAPAQPASASSAQSEVSLKATACSHGEADRIDSRTALEGFRSEAQQSLEDAVAGAAALDADGGRKARPPRPQTLEVLTEDVARGRLQRAVEPDPNRPRVTQRQHHRAAIIEPPRSKARHHSGPTEGYQLGERNRTLADGIRQQ